MSEPLKGQQDSPKLPVLMGGIHHYFHNQRNGTFEEIGLAVNEDGREQAGMGATAED